MAASVLAPQVIGRLAQVSVILGCGCPARRLYAGVFPFSSEGRTPSVAPGMHGARLRRCRAGS
jgi:hypothetical protein